jgi:hypothetical protein
MLSGVLAVTAACQDQKPEAAATPTAGTSADAPAGAAASAQADARAELVDAVRKLTGVTAVFAMTAETGTIATTRLTGKTDPANKSSTASITISAQGQQLTVEVIVIGTDMYLKMGVPLPGVDPKKWMYIDGSKTSLSKLGMNPEDPANVKGLTDAFVTVERTGPGAYKGTMDITKRDTSASTAALIKQLGDAAKSVPFEATVGADGYPTSLTITTPAAGQLPAAVTKTTFSDFGKPVAITKPPAAQVQPAPQALLSQLS